MFNFVAIFFGIILATIDTIALPILKGVHDKGWARWLLAIPVGLYAVTPMIFYSALSNVSLTIMNLVWDLMSDIIVTAVGIFFFKETIPFTKMLGVGLSFISLALMSYEGN
jgi:drug/metabolite transporter (DMT)-like permease